MAKTNNIIKLNNETIFVQIASYRDPELVPTLRSLFANAKRPNNLHVCIAWQHDEKESLEEFAKDKRVTILDIPYKESKGACWARNKIQQEYKNETYTLQLDSHHRFVENWDEECITMLKTLIAKGHSKPLLTSYIPSYLPSNDPDGRVNVPWGMSFDRFTPEGVVFFLPYYMENQPEPMPARFFSAHFVFTLGKFSTEVQHDPEYYFHGEEITLAVRAYTHGYDLFHPNKVLAWHEYTRNGRVKQWDDDPTWGHKNAACHRKVRSLLHVDNENEIQEQEYGLGTERTLEDYQIYAGINFANRSITDRCKSNKVPPGTKEDQSFEEFRHAIDLDHNDFPLEDYTFCAFIFEDKDNQPIHREDMQGEEFNRRLQQARNGSQLTVWKQYTGPKPHHIIVWPGTKDGWQNKKVITL